MNINLTLIGQSITFFLFVWFCKKYVWPPMMGAMEARQKEIADGLAAAEQGQKAQEVAEKEAAELVAQAKTQAAEIIASAEKRGNTVVEEAQQTATSEKARILDSAESEVEQQVFAAREELRGQVSSIAVAAASKIAEKEIDETVHAALLGQVRRMADNASIARPYAKAVFDLAQETNSFDDWSAALEQLAAISQDDGFIALVNDPRVEGSKTAELLTDVAKDSLPEGGANLINLLVQNDRLNSLVDIKQQYGDLVAKAKALVNAKITTALPLTADQKTSLTSALEARLGMKVEIDETVDASIIGGAIIQAGDLVIDGSAQGRLQKLTSALMR